MLPTAGLFLPESLFPKQPPNSDQAEEQSVIRKSFDRKSVQDLSNAFSSLATVFKFVEFAVALTEVSSENRIFVNKIQRVRQDLGEAIRLRTCNAVTEHFEAFPHNKSWIDGILLDIQRALNDIGVYVENVKATGDEGGAAKMKHKFEWVLGHHQKLITRELALNTCHQSLVAAINTMQAVEMGRHADLPGAPGSIAPAYQRPGRPWLEDEDDELLRGPYSRQRWRMSQRNLSLPSITISEFEGNSPKVSINSAPVELPGSTPDDLRDPDDWDLYASPPKIRRSFDDVSPLPTVAEKTVTNRELPGSKPKSMSTPIMANMAMRYRPRAIHVRKPLVKHNSLPAELPCVTRQTSLYVELAEYVLPGEEHQTDQSVVSSPDTDATTLPSSVPAPDQLAPVNTSPELKSCASATSSVENLPSASAPSDNILTPPTSSEASPIDTTPLRIETASPVPLESTSEVKMPIAEPPDNSETRQLARTTSSPSVNSPSEAYSSAAGIASPPHSPPVAEKPLITQAKRRRAHTRRLQMAYGGD